MEHLPHKDAGIFGLNCSFDDAKLVLLPVPWAATASYGSGAERAPQGILQASHQMDLEDRVFHNPSQCGIHMHRDMHFINHLNDSASCSKLFINTHSLEVNKLVECQSREALAKNKLVGVVGGDHSAPLGLIKALADKHETFSILHIDAHFDLRDSYQGYTHSHASIMHNVLHLISNAKERIQITHVGIRDFCAEEKKLAPHTFFDNDRFNHLAKGGNFHDYAQRIIQCVQRSKVYISFDIDGLSPLYCPSTGTPVPGGLDILEAFYLLEQLVVTNHTVIGFDLCEVGRSEWDFNVGARVLYKLCGAALCSNGFVPK